MLSIFDEILHRPEDIGPNCLVTPLDATDTALVTVLFFIVVATTHVAQAMSDVLP